MASTKVLNAKKEVVKTIEEQIKSAESVIVFQYQGLTVSDLKELRNKLREVNGVVKVYKNTLLKRALTNLDINMDEFMEGPNAILFGETLLEPLKALAEFAKEHDKMEIRVGILNGAVADKATINEYATIPSREGLLTMLAAGMMEHVRNLSIALNLYADKKEEENK